MKSLVAHHARTSAFSPLWRFVIGVTCAWPHQTALAADDQRGRSKDDTPTNATAAEPIKLHPQNPHYFLFRDKPAVLITAGEHYGAVLNRDFDYIRYLDTLKTHGFNLTRTFSGAYREVPGSFSITGNTLAVAHGRFLCPWARSDKPGASDGGNKFDLKKWDAAYFKRLKDFVEEAGKRGVVVELVLFCTMYDDKLWQASPMNARNNIAGVGKGEPYDVYSGKEKELLAVQLTMTRKIVTELNRFDNVYFEVCNEPYERGGLTREWNDQVIAAIVAAEADLPKKHLIAENVGHQTANVGNVNKHVSVLNFHGPAADAVERNFHFNRAIALDETGGSDRGDRKYRTEGWEFIVAGGGVFSHLDFSFTTDRPDGTAVPLPPGTPGGGGPQLRRQLSILKQFIEGFDFVRMKPDASIAKGRPDSNAPQKIRVLADVGRAYAVYVNGGTQIDLDLDLPAGAYAAEWMDTKTGKATGSERFEHSGGERKLSSPKYSEDIALRVTRDEAK
jgi:hypothetical protein